MNKYDTIQLNQHDLDPLVPFETGVPMQLLNQVLESYKMTTQITRPTEGLGRGAIRRADRAIKKAVLGTLVQDLDLNFVYLRDFDPMTGDMAPTGGTVLAYRIPMNGATVLEVASSICSPKDQFDKLEGKFRAASNFAEGRKILVKIASGGKYGKQLGAMFSNLNI